MAAANDSITDDIGPFALVPAALVADKRLSDRALRVWVTIATYANRRTGECYPLQDALAERLGASEPTLRRGIRELVRAGWLTTRARKADDGSHRKIGTIYTVHYTNGTVTSERSAPSGPVTSDRSAPGAERADVTGAERAPVARSKGTDQEQTNQTTADAIAATVSEGSVPGRVSARDLRDQRKAAADDLARGYWEWVQRETGHTPPEAFMAIRTIVEAAFKANFTTHQIKAGLVFLRNQRPPRPITRQTLWAAMQGEVPPSRPRTSGGTNEAWIEQVDRIHAEREQGEQTAS